MDENGPFIDGLPSINIYKWRFSMAMLNNQMVYIYRERDRDVRSYKMILLITSYHILLSHLLFGFPGTQAYRSAAPQVQWRT